jgi:hypothetical protein
MDETAAGADPGYSGVRKHLLYGLSLPERALRSGVSLVGGAVRESAGLLVPQAFQDSKTYTLLVRQTLDFLVQEVGGVELAEDAARPRVIENFVARKAVGNFIEMANLATVHLSPMLVLAIVSDVAYGSTAYLHEFAAELKQQGLIDDESTIHHAQDLLTAVSRASSVTASAFDTPPLSVEGLRDTINQTTEAVKQIEPTKLIPKAELDRIWQEMHSLATHEHVSVWQLSGAMTLYTMNKLGVAARGALSTVRVAGLLVDRHIVDYYRGALAEISAKGFYRTLSESSGPYVEAVWRNFSTTKGTITEDLLSGKLVGQAYSSVRRWLGYDGVRAKEIEG